MNLKKKKFLFTKILIDHVDKYHYTNLQYLERIFDILIEEIELNAFTNLKANIVNELKIKLLEIYRHSIPDINCNKTIDKLDINVYLRSPIESCPTDWTNVYESESVDINKLFTLKTKEIEINKQYVHNFVIENFNPADSDFIFLFNKINIYFKDL